MPTVAVVDYGMCNLGSIVGALDHCGAIPVVATDPSVLRAATHVVLPGVGAFGEGMSNLVRRGLDAALEEEVLGKAKPFLGICLGMQLMASAGEEGGHTKGLGWLAAVIRKLEPREPGERVPHMGWNEVHIERESPLFKGIRSGTDFYFVHSYHATGVPEGQVLARSPYCGGLVASVEAGNAFGVQFHPEKSQKPGLQLLRNFLSL